MIKRWAKMVFENNINFHFMICRGIIFKASTWIASPCMPCFHFAGLTFVQVKTAWRVCMLLMALIPVHRTSAASILLTSLDFNFECSFLLDIICPVVGPEEPEILMFLCVPDCIAQPQQMPIWLSTCRSAADPGLFCLALCRSVIIRILWSHNILRSCKVHDRRSGFVAASMLCGHITLSITIRHFCFVANIDGLRP